MRWDKNKLLILILLLSFLGFLDATYLTVLHFRNAFPPCSLYFGCETVLTSKFATIGGVPLALIGSIYYLTAVFLTIAILTTPGKLYAQGIVFVVSAGFVVSIILVLIQAFILRAFCQYCLLSEAITFILFGAIILAFRGSASKDVAK